MSRKGPKAASSILDLQASLREEVTDPAHERIVSVLLRRMTEDARKSPWFPSHLPPEAFMIWPADDIAGFLPLVRGDLATADAYQVRADMIDAVTGMYRNERTDVTRFSAADLPSPSGFAWLDQAVPMSGPRLRALSWATDNLGSDDVRVPGVRIIFWATALEYTTGPSSEIARLVRAAGSADRLLIRYMAAVSFDTPMHGSPDDEDPSRWAKVLWTLMDTPLAAQERPVLRPQSVARAATAARPAPAVRVYSLRRPVHRAGQPQGEARAIDWSCCWTVSPHFRHRRADHSHRARRDARESGPCSRCAQDCFFIPGHVKGPDDKPLRDPGRLWLVTA